MLIYVGCNKLAELICDNYVDLVIVPSAVAVPPAPPAVYVPLDRANWRTRFKGIIDGKQEIKDLINKIRKNVNAGLKPFKICSDPETRTGVAYLEYNYNQNLNSLITLKNQDNLKNKIYEYGKSAFFSSSDKSFHSSYIDPGSTVAMERIDFCSFYKFNRTTIAGVPALFGNIGNADSETVYVSVDIFGDGTKSSQVFEFLDIIRRYFANLRSGAVIVDIGISGPVKRLIIGGDFGCNLLNDVEVCRKFKSKQMKIYTSDKNKDALFNDTATNHIFMIDVDLEPAAQGGGGNSDGYKNNQNNQNNQKRICIGECIEDKNRVVTSKRKTRRKVPLLLSSS